MMRRQRNGLMQLLRKEIHLLLDLGMCRYVSTTISLSLEAKEIKVRSMEISGYLI